MTFLGAVLCFSTLLGGAYVGQWIDDHLGLPDRFLCYWAMVVIGMALFAMLQPLAYVVFYALTLSLMLALELFARRP